MSKTFRDIALAGLATVAASVLAATPAAAATTQVDHQQLDLYFSHIDQCGFTVNSHVVGTMSFQTFTDSAGNVSFQNVAHVISTLTNVANGKVVYVEGSGRDSFGGPGVVNPDGTVSYLDVLTGIDQRVYTSHSSVLLKDAGYLAIVDTFDAQGNFLNEQLIVHGPHQFAGDFSAYCDAITAAIG